MNTPVNFELAKLLKEKGFDIPKNKMYCRSIPMFEKHHVVKFYDGDKHECSEIPHDWNNTESTVGSTEYYSAPTIAEVVMWLYEKHGVWIEVGCPEDKYNNGWISYVYNVGEFDCLFTSGNKLSPTEAYEAAIEYTLTNFI